MSSPSDAAPPPDPVRQALIGKPRRWFVTGGAGFIGSHVVDLLVSAGHEITVYDNLSLSTDRYLARHLHEGRITFHQKDLLDLAAVTEAMAGHDIVFHLAANTDIPSGFTKHRIDLDNDVIATWNVLEAMVKTGVKELLFSSTGAVYGESIQGTFSETSGPLLPVSLYGAGKIGSEAFISAYCNLFGLRAWIYRFGNVIGERTNHGVIYDFIAKLKKDPRQLEVLGTGRGEKNYFLVEECIHGILYVHGKLPDGPFPVLVNLGTDSTTQVMDISKIIIEEMGLSEVRYAFTGTPRGWPGDQPVVLLDTQKIHELGWYARRTSTDAVRTATRRLLGTDPFRLTVDTLS
jgi:UDP-glucose 4-epimerase